ncbi:MAG TPA: bifunctional phosphoribosyl-AMP cyclohydrolase/phosphoribosyl-ATP diphosphatase HisIE [Dehalococcoidia bacterium]|nr:bifunctional phosphoribosyl-AMP cyclohydrolase/phosphoribosyl-ATP diphosphatase HisIE [Dehalococcoidia bacterium]
MLTFDGQGLVPAIIQHHKTGRVLMLGYMNAESLRRTRETGLVWFYSRSRRRLWQKGETSGNVLRVRSIAADCDRDTLLIHVEPAGPVCHTGAADCFFDSVDAETGSMTGVQGPESQVQSERSGAVQAGSVGLDRAAEPETSAEPASSRILEDLFAVIEDRRRSLPEGSYTTYLFTQGIDKIGKKVGEEAAEVIIAAKNGVPERIAEEVADLWYHTLVALAATGVTPEEVFEVLAKRRK